ncbi:hypothetical protein Ciccas_002662 [Cichlidogyrus casuarinus]|uniref:C2H2-type domain-containing protein n=1 Tax=Cichlidogyrus casuarinus TaxID=1844966 RepID=A0ABD2QGK1_9PLAT
MYLKSDEYLQHRLLCDNEPIKQEAFTLPINDSKVAIKEEKPFSCAQCPKSFKSKPLLEQHMHIHYPPRYKCSWCGNLYRWPPVYYHHKQKCRLRPNCENNSQSLEPLQPLPKSVAETSPINNSVFHPDQFNLLNSLSSNLFALQALNSLMNSNDNQQCHPMEHISSEAEAPTIPCVCGYRSKDYSVYTQHTSMCPFVQLNSEFRQQNSLQNWIQLLTNSQSLQQQSMEESQPCDLSINSRLSREDTGSSQETACLSSTRAPYKRKNTHNRDTYHDIIEVDRNTDGKQFRCRLCDKTFSSKLSIKQHIDGKHSDKGKFVCAICNKRYRWGASFYYHRKICGQAHAHNLGRTKSTRTDIGGKE